MDNSTVIPLEGDLLLTNQLELVTPTTVAGTLYGIAFTLFCLYVHSLFPRLRDGDRKRQARFMLGFSSIVMLCGLYILIGSTWVVQDAYIKHNNYPDGPAFYEGSTYHTAVIMAEFSYQWIVDTSTSAIQVRCFTFCHIPRTLAEFKDRFGVYGLSGALLNTAIWSSYYPCSVS
jgi:hypothetical protein